MKRTMQFLLFLLLGMPSCPLHAQQTFAASEVKIEIDQNEKAILGAPNGKWEAMAVPSVNPDGNARLLLKNLSSEKALELGEYSRSGLITWSRDSALLLFLDWHSADDGALIIFDVDNRYHISQRTADQKIKADVARLVGGSYKVDFYNYIDVAAKSGNTITTEIYVRAYLRKNIQHVQGWMMRYEFSLVKATLRCISVKADRY